MPLPGHELFLAAIRDQPDDDTLRLAYADWLDENGDPERAEFVRVQCQLAALGHGPLWPRAGIKEAKGLARGLSLKQAELILRQAELWEASRGEWLGELPDLPHCDVLFHRRFATSVVISDNPGALVRDGAWLFLARRSPVWVFRDCRPDAVEVGLMSPWFDSIRGLTVAGRTRWPRQETGSRRCYRAPTSRPARPEPPRSRVDERRANELAARRSSASWHCSTSPGTESVTPGTVCGRAIDPTDSACWT